MRALGSADLATKKHYLTMLRFVVANTEAEGSPLAELEDSVAVQEGRRQIYGTMLSRDDKTAQFYVVALEDPDHVDAPARELDRHAARSASRVEYRTRLEAQDEGRLAVHVEPARRELVEPALVLVSLPAGHDAECRAPERALVSWDDAPVPRRRRPGERRRR